MIRRFHIGSGRFPVLSTSRFKSFTYGRNSFASQQPELANQEAHGTYGALLFDKRWSSKRAEILARDNSRCVVCNSEINLQVHHRQYHFIKALQQFKAPWDYDNHLLVTLCERCHSRGHSKFRVPNVYL